MARGRKDCNLSMIGGGERNKVMLDYSGSYYIRAMKPLGAIKGERNA